MNPSNFQVIHPNSHAKTRLKREFTFDHCVNVNNVELLAPEFPIAASEYPIMFLRNPELGGFRAVAITGLEKDENLFVNENTWQGKYTPGSVGLYPFRIQRSNKEAGEDNVVNVDLMIDHACSRVNEVEGDLLFEDGKETPVLSRYRAGLTQYYKDVAFTNQFITYLADNELLIERALSFNINGESQELYGMFSIDHEKLNSMDDAQFLTLRKLGHLPLIYAQLNSYFQFDALARRKQATKK